MRPRPSLLIDSVFGDVSSTLDDEFNSQLPITAYTLMGQKVDADSDAYKLYDKLHKGIYILKDSKGKTKKVIKK